MKQLSSTFGFPPRGSFGVYSLWGELHYLFEDKISSNLHSELITKINHAIYKIVGAKFSSQDIGEIANEIVRKFK